MFRKLAILALIIVFVFSDSYALPNKSGATSLELGSTMGQVELPSPTNLPGEFVEVTGKTLVSIKDNG